MRAPRFFGLPVFAGLILTTVFALAWPSLATAAEPGRLYVATNGSDAWSGALAEANPAKTDGPFATLARARDEIRKWKKASKLPEGGVTVIVRGGIHELKEPLALTAEDGGTKQSPIVYQAAENEKVIISGGRQVKEFQPVKDAAVLARLDESARGKVLAADLRAMGISNFGSANGGGIQLYFQDKPMTLARWPNEGFVKIVDVLKNEPVDCRGTTGDKVGKFVYDGDRPKRWIGEKDPWVHGYWFWDWSDQRHKIASIDPEGRVISVARPYHIFGYRKGQWYYGMNLLAELDSPGEWYVDRQAGILYFWPPAALDEGLATVSVLDTLVTLREVNHVTLRGVTFEAARGNAVTVAGGTGVLVAQCVLRNIGNTAVSIFGGRANGVEGCEMLSSGRGRYLPGRRQPQDAHARWPLGHEQPHPRLRAMEADVSPWHLPARRGPAGGQQPDPLGPPYRHPVRRQRPPDRIERNPPRLPRVERRRGQSIRAATGPCAAPSSGITSCTTSPASRNKGCVGVYLDDMFCGVEITGNVFYKVTRAAFIGGGRDVSITNNVFVDCNPAFHIDARALNWAADTVPTTMTERLVAMPYKEELWASRYPKLVGIPRRPVRRAERQCGRRKRLFRRPLGRNRRRGKTFCHPPGQSHGGRPRLCRRREAELPVSR